jgi:hypothetical protein
VGSDHRNARDRRSQDLREDAARDEVGRPQRRQNDCCALSDVFCCVI